MELSKETIQEFKDITEKEHGKEISWQEATDGAYGLTRLVQLFYDQGIIEHERKLKLEKNPKGFHLEGEGYSCFICGGSISNEETWYDKWGIKCLICQKAIDKKIIPGSAAKNQDSWYSEYDLRDSFNIDRHGLKRFVKEGVLKPRIVPNESGKTHVQIFLIKDNKDTLPPKKLVESEHVSYEGDEKGVVHIEPWYRFVDPYEHLKGYKIMDYLKFSVEKEK